DNDITLGVYTGASHPLTPVACFTDNQSVSSGGESGSVFLEAGVTYYFRIGVKPNVQVDAIRLRVIQRSVSWQGTISSDWYEGGNWNTEMVPDSGNIITIREGLFPAILPSGTVNIVSLRVRGDGSFTLAEGATMRISGSTRTEFTAGASGMPISSGQAIINGNLIISDVDSVGLDTDGGPLTIGPAGYVEISGAKEGIANGNFTNHGSISIFNITDAAIITNTNCANFGNITLTDVAGYGIDFSGTFTHEGNMMIQNLGDDGIQTSVDTLQVGATATITIDSVRRGLNGLLLVNDGIITINTTSSDAINTGGNSINNGIINISNVGFDGLDLEAGSTFTNTGTIRIFDTDDQALESGLFVQTATGELFIAGEITSAMQLAPGSALHPGSSPGCVNSDTLSSLAGVELYVELEGTTACAEYDQLQFGDQAVDLTDAVLVLSGDYIPEAGDEFVIMERLSAANITGTFAGLPEGGTTIFNGAELTITYVGGDGDDVVLTATAILPLDLLSFTGEAREKSNFLTWTTANEEDFSHFEVERSADVIVPWSVLAQPDLKASGEHEYIDESPLSAAYYRLKMVDLDGTFTYSEVVYLEHLFSENAGAMQVFPNPSEGQFIVEVSIPLQTEHKQTLELRDLHGRILWQYTISSGDTRLQPTLPNLASGVYLLVYRAGDQRSTQRLVIR
ncbi:MAG: T9SS type A sorting domain-containing protein, partial [Bacteroidota bacterium]